MPKSKNADYQQYKPEIINKMLNFARVLSYSLSPAGEILSLNEYVISETGYSEDDLMGRNFWNFVPRDYKKGVIDFYLNQLRGKTEFTVNEFPIISKTGEYIWMQQEVCARFDETGEVSGYDIFGTVITERKKTELELYEIVDKHRRLMREIPDGYYRLDLKGNLLEYNESLLNLIGYDEFTINGMNYRLLSSDDETAEFTRKAFNSVFRSKNRIKELEWELVRGDGDTIYVSTSISPVIDRSTGEVAGFEGILRDITERINELKQMTNLATRDMLTGLYNRFWFIEFVKKSLALGFREKKGAAAVLFIDGNDFKEINDSLGHEEGDKMLKKISRAIIRSVRATDVVSRYGGDEFCIYLSEIEYNVEKIVKKIISNIEKIPYMVSIGCQTIDFNSDMCHNINSYYDGILNKADDNLYCVKDAVRDLKKEVPYNNVILEITSSAYKIDTDGTVIYPG